MNNEVGTEKQYDTHLSYSYLRTQTTDENINPRNGELSLTQTDYVLSGRNGMDVEIKRIYKSSGANIGNMKVKYANGTWIDYVDSSIEVSSFFENRYNLGVGMRFSFETLEIPNNIDEEDKESDEINTILLHTETGDVYTLRAYLLDTYDKEEYFKKNIQDILTNTEKVNLQKGLTVKNVYI